MDGDAQRQLSGMKMRFKMHAIKFQQWARTNMHVSLLNGWRTESGRPLPHVVFPFHQDLGLIGVVDLVLEVLGIRHDPGQVCENKKGLDSGKNG